MSLFSCEKYIILPPVIEEGVSFSTQIQPIFDDGCVSCHSGVIDPDLRPENSYEALFDGVYVDTLNPEASTIYTELRDGHNSRATEEEKLLILQWIKEGALNN
jgi:hypothetical protein